MSNPPADHTKALLEITRSQGRIEGRIEQFFSLQARQDERLNDHDKRIAALEDTQSEAKGWRLGAGWVAAGVAAVVAFLTDLFGVFK